MPTKLDWDSPTVKYEITFENGEYRAAADIAAQLTKLGEEMRGAIAAHKFVVDRQGQSSKYDFNMIMDDGREWTQVLTFDNGPDPLIEFTSTDLWRASELQVHAKIWSFLVGLVALGVTKLKLEYL